MVFPLLFSLMTGQDKDLYKTRFFSSLNKSTQENEIFFNENNNLKIITLFVQATVNTINNVFFHLQFVREVVFIYNNQYIVGSKF